jgi:hypothetical protein
MSEAAWRIVWLQVTMLLLRKNGKRRSYIGAKTSHLSSSTYAVDISKSGSENLAFLYLENHLQARKWTDQCMGIQSLAAGTDPRSECNGHCRQCYPCRAINFLFSDASVPPLNTKIVERSVGPGRFSTVLMNCLRQLVTPWGRQGWRFILQCVMRLERSFAMSHPRSVFSCISSSFHLLHYHLAGGVFEGEYDSAHFNPHMVYASRKCPNA